MTGMEEKIATRTRSPEELSTGGCGVSNQRRSIGKAAPGRQESSLTAGEPDPSVTRMHGLPESLQSERVTGRLETTGEAFI